MRVCLLLVLLLLPALAGAATREEYRKYCAGVVAVIGLRETWEAPERSTVQKPRGRAIPEDPADLLREAGTEPSPSNNEADKVVHATMMRDDVSNGSPELRTPRDVEENREVLENLYGAIPKASTDVSLDELDFIEAFVIKSRQKSAFPDVQKLAKKTLARIRMARYRRLAHWLWKLSSQPLTEVETKRMGDDLKFLTTGKDVFLRDAAKKVLEKQFSEKGLAPLVQDATLVLAAWIMDLEDSVGVPISTGRSGLLFPRLRHPAPVDGVLADETELRRLTALYDQFVLVHAAVEEKRLRDAAPADWKQRIDDATKKEPVDSATAMRFLDAVVKSNPAIAAPIPGYREPESPRQKFADERVRQMIDLEEEPLATQARRLVTVQILAARWDAVQGRSQYDRETAQRALEVFDKP